MKRVGARVGIMLIVMLLSGAAVGVFNAATHNTDRDATQYGLGFFAASMLGWAITGRFPYESEGEG